MGTTSLRFRPAWQVVVGRIARFFGIHVRIFRYLFRAVCNEMHNAGFLSITCLIDKANSQSVEAFRLEGFEFHNAAVLELPRIKPVLLCRAFA